MGCQTSMADQGCMQNCEAANHRRQPRTNQTRGGNVQVACVRTPLGLQRRAPLTAIPRTRPALHGVACTRGSGCFGHVSNASVPDNTVLRCTGSGGRRLTVRRCRNLVVRAPLIPVALPMLLGRSVTALVSVGWQVSARIVMRIGWCASWESLRVAVVPLRLFGVLVSRRARLPIAKAAQDKKHVYTSRFVRVILAQGPC